MQFFGVLILAGMLCISFTFEEKIFRTESHKKGEENVIIITEKKTGKRITEIDVFENDEYQVAKPEDEDYCLVSRILTREADSRTCFKRINASVEMQEDLKIDLTECGDRAIVFLKPTKCLKTVMDVNPQPMNRLTEERSYSCIIVEKNVISPKVEYHILSYCHRYITIPICVRRDLWGKCLKYGYSKICAEYRTRSFPTYFCF